ncbi:hypothetical protein LTR60_005149, partial [Cryomyces antarcticus]
MPLRHADQVQPGWLQRTWTTVKGALGYEATAPEPRRRPRRRTRSHKKKPANPLVEKDAEEQKHADYDTPSQQPQPLHSSHNQKRAKASDLKQNEHKPADNEEDEDNECIVVGTSKKRALSPDPSPKRQLRQRTEANKHPYTTDPLNCVFKKALPPTHGHDDSDHDWHPDDDSPSASKSLSTSKSPSASKSLSTSKSPSAPKSAGHEAADINANDDR